MPPIDPIHLSITAFLFGLMGSPHCIGMCGPIALALPPHQNMVWGRLIYNLGRVVAYMLMGLGAGFIGLGAHLMGWQQGVSIASGVLLIITAIVSGGKLTPSGRISRAIGDKIRPVMAHLFRQRHFLAMLFIGVLNGFLPCGFAYSALAASLNGGTLANAVLFMGFFGLGTLPAMFSVSVLGSAISLKWRQRFYKLAPFITALLGILLIIRGLNIGHHLMHH